MYIYITVIQIKLICASIDFDLVVGFVMNFNQNELIIKYYFCL